MDQLKSVKATDGLLLVIDEFGKMIYVSESSLQYTGFRSLDLNGQSWFSLLHPDDQVYSRAHLRQAVTRCHTVSQSIPASPSSPTNTDQPSPPNNSRENGGTSSPTSSFRSTLTCRLLQGTRPRKSQTASSCQQEDAASSLPEHRANDFKPDVTRDDTHVYRPFVFTGTARAITLSAGASGNGGWVRSVVWVAVGRPSLSTESRPSSPACTGSRQEVGSPSRTPSHFVLRHDLTGRISYVDQRCKYFTGYEPSDLVGQVIFDHLVPEDSRYLTHQYNQLRAGLESIAVVYRFRRADKTDDCDTYLNCRAYVTLNPLTFKSDQITSLATAISDDEGQAEVAKQAFRLQQSEAASKTRQTQSEGQTKIQLTCAHEHKSNGAGNDKENCRTEPGSTKSPLQSPDSNTHPIDVSPLSTGSDNSGQLVDQVAIIDSQYSPSKHPSDEENAAPNVITHQATSQAANSKAFSQARGTEKSPMGSRKNGQNGNSKNSKQGRSNQSIKQEEAQRKSVPASPTHHHHFFLPCDMPPHEHDPKLPGPGPANTLFHDQLREKHLYLEDSIRNQQNQLQMLQQKLMTLANHGAGIYPMQLQLQSPLNKVMELQNRVGRHREEAIQQRSLVDGRPQIYHPGPPGGLQRRNSTPLIPVGRSRPPQPALVRRSSVMAENTANYTIRPNSELIGLPEFESGRRSAGVLSPPFVDMAEPQAPARAPSVDPLDALYTSLDLDSSSDVNLGPDFEEKLRELEMLFTPNFNGGNQSQAPPPPSPAGHGRPSENASPYGRQASLTINNNGS